MKFEKIVRENSENSLIRDGITAQQIRAAQEISERKQTENDFLTRQTGYSRDEILKIIE